MMFVVNKLAPVNVIMTRPMGNMTDPSHLMRPGALSWYQGEALMLRFNAQLYRNPSAASLASETGGLDVLTQSPEGRCHARVDEEPVESLSGLLAAYPRDKLMGLC